MKILIIQIGVVIQTAIVLVVNYLAAAGFINNTTPADISGKYPIVLMPAGYAFSIWSLIYVGMTAFSVYQALPGQTKSKHLESIRLPYVVLCAANIGWIFAWHYDLIHLSFVMMAALLVLLAFINGKLTGVESWTDKIVVRLPFSIYFGWITVATCLNALIMLAYFGVSFGETTAAVVGVLLITLVVVIGVLVRFKLDSMAYPITIAWGITAIGVEQSGKTVVVLATAIGMMVLIFFALWGYVRDR